MEVVAGDRLRAVGGEHVVVVVGVAFLGHDAGPESIKLNELSSIGNVSGLKSRRLYLYAARALRYSFLAASVFFL